MNHIIQNIFKIYKLYQTDIQGNILISDFSATIDDRPTEIREESSIVLR